MVVVVGSTEGTTSVILGFRADFKMTVTVGAADSEPGAGAEGAVFGGRGCGGCESLGSVYYTRSVHAASAVMLEEWVGVRRLTGILI